MKDVRAIEPLLRHIKLIAFAESMGGTESLMTTRRYRRPAPAVFRRARA